ncbi:hypothetical protein [Falsihalocynthiibacter arcticus]|uniref:Uncharacterized protein n=1 Tax=Falsihalocynthiibacter arcticus TaxID=1579316 RepID=A0A126UZB5_9RHOB|nr:hypothetical protein [Falsihalocynthiibacter arcticus]AML51403.1 hypothetical protein RC74_09180 [Falsihalocynthiibacter arcticus]
MRGLKLACLSIAGLVAAFVLHVPVLTVYSNLSTPSDLRAYPSLSQGVKSQNYEIERLVYGASEIWFDHQANNYLIIADLIKGGKVEYSGRFIVTVGEDGHFIEHRRVTSTDPLPDFDADPRFSMLNTAPERIYVPNYRFDALEGQLDLVKYQFTAFSERPYFYYFIPVIPFDWTGIGYFNLKHQGETLSFQLPTNFYGGPLYTTSNIDGQLYVARREKDALGVAFLEVAESSYTHSMDGGETHREAYGLHVIRPRRH